MKRAKNEAQHMVQEIVQDDATGHLRAVFYGPFDDYDDALAWAEAKMDRYDKWWLVPLIDVKGTEVEE